MSCLKTNFIASIMIFRAFAHISSVLTSEAHEELSHIQVNFDQLLYLTPQPTYNTVCAIDYMRVSRWKGQGPQQSFQLPRAQE